MKPRPGVFYLTLKKEFMNLREDQKPLADRIITDENFLRQQCRLTSFKELEKIKFVDRVKNALNFSWTKGYGLAAIQIGIPIQAAWFRVPVGGEIIERLIFNPIVLKTEGTLYFPEEGCLSIPNRRMTTKRFRSVTVKNGNGELIEARDIFAVILQHEIGHMNGELCVDHLVAAKSMPGRNDACPCASGAKFKKCCLK